MDSRPIPLDSVIVIDDDSDVEEVVVSSTTPTSPSNRRPHADDEIGVISFHLPYLVSQHVEKSDMDVERIGSYVEMSISHAFNYAINDDESPGLNPKLAMMLDDAFPDIVVTHYGSADGIWDKSHELGHMMECVITVHAPGCKKKAMDCLLYISSRLFRFGRSGARMGRYFSNKHGINVERMDCMRHLAGTLFCIPNNKEN